MTLVLDWKRKFHFVAAAMLVSAFFSGSLFVVHRPCRLFWHGNRSAKKKKKKKKKKKTRRRHRARCGLSQLLIQSCGCRSGRYWLMAGFVLLEHYFVDFFGAAKLNLKRTMLGKRTLCPRNFLHCIAARSELKKEKGRSFSFEHVFLANVTLRLTSKPIFLSLRT